MSPKRTGTTSFQVSITSGNELPYNEYSNGVSYIPSHASLETNKVISKGDYASYRSDNRISTESSRIHDNVAGINKRLKNINP